MPDIDVFVSVGGTANEQQESFVRAIEDRLRAEGLNPRTVGRNTFSSDAPIKTVARLMDQCCGTVVIAMERLYIESGQEKRDGPQEKRLSNVAIATPWNQIEAAMAYSRGMPLFVLVQKGLKQEGLLERGYDWYVQEVDIDTAVLSTSEFNGVLASWRQKVLSAKRGGVNSSEPKDPAEMTLGEIVGNLRPSQLWATLGAIGTVIAGAFALGARLFS